MKESLKKLNLQPEALVSLSLVGLLLLCALLYYRAVNVQRFLEPALALSQPRIEFAERLAQIHEETFGAKSVQGIALRTNAILVDKALIFDDGGKVRHPAPPVFAKLGRMLHAAFTDERTKPQIGLVLIHVRFPAHGREAPRDWRNEQQKAGAVLDSLYRAEPALRRDFGAYVVAAAAPASPLAGKIDKIEIRFVPTEFVHMEVLQRLEKYAQ